MPPSAKQRGRFFTRDATAHLVARRIHAHLGDTLGTVVEPFCGSGNLLAPLARHHTVANDLEHHACCTHHDDTLSDSAENLAARWDLACLPRPLLVYSNPPWGSTSKKKRLFQDARATDEQVRVAPTELARTFGSRDLLYPALGQMARLAAQQRAHLAFFAPFSIFNGRPAAKALLRFVLCNFRFLEGAVFSGKHFENVVAKKPIAFALFEPGTTAHLADLSFGLSPLLPDADATAPLVRAGGEWTLLRDGWRHDQRKGEPDTCLVAPHRASFDEYQPALLHATPRLGGSAMIPENVKVPVDVCARGVRIPSELVYGLWSVTVGSRGLTPCVCPVWFGNALTHLPTRWTPPYVEVLALSALAQLLNNRVQPYLPPRLLGGYGDAITFGNFLEPVRALWDEIRDLEILPDLTVARLLDDHPHPTRDPRAERAACHALIARRLHQLGYWRAIVVP